MILVLAGAGVYVLRGDGRAAASPAIRTAVAEPGAVRVVLRETGVIRPYRQVVVTSVVSGRLARLHAREGSVVEAGQVVAVVEPDLNNAQVVSQVRSAYEAAKLRAEVAEREYERAEALFAGALITEQELARLAADVVAARLQLETTEVQLRIMEESGILAGADADLLNVVSPASGVVIARGVEEGEAVQAGTGVFGGGTPIITVASLDRLKIESEINEIDIGRVEAGRPVRITLDAYPGVEFAGVIAHVSPAARDRGGVRVFDVEIEVTGSDPRLRPGMTANVDITGIEKDGVLTVPIESVFRVNGRDIVYRMVNGSPQPVEVEVGLVDTQRVEILSGLEAGDVIAAEDPVIAAERAVQP